MKKIENQQDLQQKSVLPSNESMKIKYIKMVKMTFNCRFLSILLFPVFAYSKEDSDQFIRKLEASTYSDISFYPRLGLAYNGGPVMEPGVILLGSKFDHNGTGMGFGGIYSDCLLKYDGEFKYGPNLGIELGCAGNVSAFAAAEYGYIFSKQEDYNRIKGRLGLSLAYLNIYGGYNWCYTPHWLRSNESSTEFGFEVNFNMKGIGYFFP